MCVLGGGGMDRQREKGEDRHIDGERKREREKWYKYTVIKSNTYF